MKRAKVPCNDYDEVLAKMIEKQVKDRRERIATQILASLLHLPCGDYDRAAAHALMATDIFIKQLDQEKK